MSKNAKNRIAVVDGGTETKTCLRPECGRPNKCRGLCNSCYESTLKAVKEEKYTWAQLEASGAALPARKRKGAVESWLASIVK